MYGAHIVRLSVLIRYEAMSFSKGSQYRLVPVLYGVYHEVLAGSTY